MEYQVLLVLTDDFVACVNRVAQLHSARNVEEFDWSLLPQRSYGLEKPNQAVLTPRTIYRFVERWRIFQKQNCVYCYAGLFGSNRIYRHLPVSMCS